MITVADTPNVADIQRALEVFHPKGQVFEIRAFGVADRPNGTWRHKTVSGYFDDPAAAAQGAKWLDDRGADGIYCTINPCQPDLFARAPSELELKPQHTTTDREILRRHWLLVDIDPHRPAGICSTDAELNASRDLGDVIIDRLRRYGFPYPLWQCSGNGTHLFYRIDLPNTDETTALVRGVLRGINELAGAFDPTRPYATVDQGVFNAARIVRVGGTLNRKGGSTATRPHRRAELRSPEVPVDPVPSECLQAVAELAAERHATTPAAKPHTNGSSTFPRLDVAKYLNDHGVGFETKAVDGGVAFRLKKCPFDSNHGGRGETALVQANTGLLTFHCMHAGCQGRRWADFRQAIGDPRPEHFDRPPRSNGIPKGPAEVAPGTLVRAKDRDNFGTVLADDGDTCSVRFVSPDGAVATVALPKSQLVTKGGLPLIDQAEPPAFANVIGTRDFLTMDLRQEYLVKDVIVCGQQGTIGGRSKCCKTLVALDMVLSVASGTPFLNHFEVPKPAPVLLLSYESGGATLQKTFRRMAEARGFTLDAMAELPIYWQFEDRVCLSDESHLAAMAGLVERLGVKLAIVDPLYLTLFGPGDVPKSGDLFYMGQRLAGLGKLCRSTGVALYLCHHFRKSAAQDETEPAGLEELSMSGLGEFVRQWVLLQRRRPYANDGRHELWARIGGSSGHAGLYGLTVDEGLHGDAWRAEVLRVGDVRAEIQQQKANRKAAEAEQRDGEHRRRLLDALSRFPEGETAHSLRVAAGLNPDNFGRAITTILKEGRATPCEVAKGKRIFEGYMPCKL